MTSAAVDVPYVPILGPVHPLEITPELWDVLATAGSNLLPFDKTSRWSNVPTEQILDVRTDDNYRIITTQTATKTTRRYVYGSQGDRSVAYNTLPVCNERITFSKALRPLHKHEKASRIFIDTFLPASYKTDNHIREYSDDLVSAWQEFATSCDDTSVVQGFQMAIEHQTGPVYVYMDGGVIMGTIGPLTTLQDSRGVIRLLPSYFLVHQQYRKGGIGRALWQAMRHWAISHDAQYVVLQAEVGAAAEHFYETLGLESLGFVYRFLNNSAS